MFAMLDILHDCPEDTYIESDLSHSPFAIQNGEKLSRGLKLLGLCSFGYIKDRESLINDNPNEFNYVRYNSNQEIVKGDNVPLNGDHTHFLLIDDGSRYRFLGGYTDFITKFETFIRDPEPKVSRVDRGQGDP